MNSPIASCGPTFDHNKNVNPSLGREHIYNSASMHKQAHNCGVEIKIYMHLYNTVIWNEVSTCV